MDRPLRREDPSTRPARMAWLSLFAAAGKVPREVIGPALGAIDPSVDCLVTDAGIQALEPEAACDLLW